MKLNGFEFICLFSSFPFKMLILNTIGAEEFVILAPIFELIITSDPLFSFSDILSPAMGISDVSFEDFPLLELVSPPFDDLLA
jgi:hypothetical protein